MTKSLNTERVEQCPLCNATGRPLYDGVRDHVFGTPGDWSFSHCLECGCLWLNPRLTKEDIPKAYQVGYTHYSDSTVQAGSGLVRSLKRARSLLVREGMRRYVGLHGNAVLQAVTLLPPLNGWSANFAKFLKQGHGKKLLDIGCGSGGYLALMREAGWDVLGVESDSLAARVAREEFQLPVVEGTIENVQLPERSFDAITIDNVIEHVPYPIDVLKRCYDLLKPGGVLVVRTPNTGSLGHKVFKGRWGPLLPPQHLVLFSPKTLTNTIELVGFHVTKLTTVSYAATSPCSLSRSYFSDTQRSHYSLMATMAVAMMLVVGVGFQVIEGFVNALMHTYGEEIGIVAVKPK